jgi:hypothetical protein
LPPAVALLIENTSEGWFLFRLAADGSDAGDTWHGSLDDARHQAATEFEVTNDSWREVPRSVDDPVAFITSEARRSRTAHALEAREMHRYVPFPFEGDRFPSNLGAVVQHSVLNGDEPARLVIHTRDNSWLVGDGRNDPNVPGAVIATHILHVVEVDPMFAALATLPIGQVAERENANDPWRFRPMTDEDLMD